MVISHILCYFPTGKDASMHSLHTEDEKICFDLSSLYVHLSTSAYISLLYYSCPVSSAVINLSRELKLYVGMCLSFQWIPKIADHDGMAETTHQLPSGSLKISRSPKNNYLIFNSIEWFCLSLNNMNLKSYSLCSFVPGFFHSNGFVRVIYFSV